jgi:uncharacterized membrane protein (DUF4010 family)
MGGDDVALDTALLGIVIAASVNSLVKGGMALSIGGKRLGRLVLAPLSAAVASGLAAAALAPAPG